MCSVSLVLRATFCVQKGYDASICMLLRLITASKVLWMDRVASFDDLCTEKSIFLSVQDGDHPFASYWQGHLSSLFLISRCELWKATKHFTPL